MVYLAVFIVYIFFSYASNSVLKLTYYCSQTPYSGYCILLIHIYIKRILLPPANLLYRVIKWELYRWHQVMTVAVSIHIFQEGLHCWVMHLAFCQCLYKWAGHISLGGLPVKQLFLVYRDGVLLFYCWGRSWNRCLYLYNESIPHHGTTLMNRWILSKLGIHS